MPEFPNIKSTPEFTPPLESPGWPWWAWAIVGVFALVPLIFFIRMVFRRKPPFAPPPAPPLASHVLALNLLEDLRARCGTLAPKEFAARVVEIIRTYLHRQFGILARYKTTEEILAKRRDPASPPPPPAIRAFEEFLVHTDALNYGGAAQQDLSYADVPAGKNLPPSALLDEAIAVIRRSQDALHAKT